jgi:hypothetical protein
MMYRARVDVVLTQGNIASTQYLNRGKLTDRIEVASIYSSPSAASRALNVFIARNANPGKVYLPIIIKL